MSDKLEKSYMIAFNKLKEFDNSGNNEQAHIVQDKLYRKFIRDIVNNKFSNMDELKLIANNMNKFVVKNDTGRWYS